MALIMSAISLLFPILLQIIYVYERNPMYMISHACLFYCPNRSKLLVLTLALPQRFSQLLVYSFSDGITSIP